MAGFSIAPPDAGGPYDAELKVVWDASDFQPEKIREALTHMVAGAFLELDKREEAARGKAG